MDSPSPVSARTCCGRPWTASEAPLPRPRGP